jgi:hypothetical protein
MHVRVTNGHPENYTIGQLRRDNPNTSFPKTIPDALLAEYRIYPVTVLPQPTTAEWEVATRTDLPTLVDGIWTLGWTVTQVPEEKVERSVRDRRDRLLSQTDWMALTDNTMTQPWADYRQALRNVTDQAGFPYNVTWPTKPE